MALRLKTLCDLPESCYSEMSEGQIASFVACASLEAIDKPIDKRVSSSATYRTLLRTLHHFPEHNNKAYSRWMLAFIAANIQTVNQAILWAYTIERIRVSLDKVDTHPLTLNEVFGPFPARKLPNDEGYDLAWFATTNGQATSLLEDMNNWRFENLEDEEKKESNHDLL